MASEIVIGTSNYKYNWTSYWAEMSDSFYSGSDYSDRTIEKLLRKIIDCNYITEAQAGSKTEEKQLKKTDCGVSQSDLKLAAQYVQASFKIILSGHG